MKVLIVDDHPIVISGFKALIEGIDGYQVIEASNAQAAEAAMERESFDIAVVDVNLPGVAGFELVKRMLTAKPATRIIMFSMNDDPMFVVQAMKQGAKGYVSKNDDPVAMLNAIRDVCAGGTAWPPNVVARLAQLIAADAAGPPSLTQREQDILRQLVKGKSLSEIGDSIGLSYKTVAMTCAALRTKLGARTQAELVAIAVERRLFG